MPRCEATKRVSPGSTLWGPAIGALLDRGAVVEKRCQDEADHKGPHWSTVQPFPGFADTRVEWSEAVA